ncbi:MAG: hypothetical protein FD155_341 [Bacteroidetes bacterium]|nr:MAG: hypothetical protein FD155_341 [Bacteroidota bacterium]
MIQIEKTPYPEFKNFVQRNNPQNWEGLDAVVRTNTRKYILENEQSNQCAYTELPLEYEKNNSHIEHLKRKDSAFFPELTFKWTNLFVSCNSDDFGGKYKDEKYLKGKTKADNALIINPALENPNEYFELTYWGELTIKDDLQEIAKTKAEETIKAFYLNHNSLQDRRREMIQSVNDYKNGGLDSEMIIEFLSGSGFKSVIKYELEN